MIVTLLFSQGAILASRKTNYADIIGHPDYLEKITKIMKAQHKGMIKELLSGRHTVDSGEAGNEAEDVQTDIKETETPAEAADQQEEKIASKTQVIKSLDDILLNYIMRRNNK